MLSQRPPSLCNTTATSHLSTLSHSDISAWTDGSVPGGLGQGGAGIHIKCTKCATATSLSFSVGLWATSYSAETFAILHALEWCVSHSKICNFESITFFSILYLFYQLSLPPTIFNPQISIYYTISSQFSITIQGSPSTMDTWPLFPPR